MADFYWVHNRVANIDDPKLTPTIVVFRIDHIVVLLMKIDNNS